MTKQSLKVFIVLAILVVLPVMGFCAWVQYRAHQLEENFGIMTESMAYFGRLEYETFSYRWPYQFASIHGAELVLEGEPSIGHKPYGANFPDELRLPIQEIRIYDIDVMEDLGITIDMHVEYIGAELNVRALSEDVYGALENLGYDGKMLLDLSVEQKYIPEARLLDIKQLRVAAEGYGALRLSASLGNLDFSLGDRGQNLELHRLSFAYEDDSLFNRSIEYLAEEAGVSAGEYRAQLDILVDGMVAPVLPAFAPALTQYINTPGTLRVVMEPPEPLRVVEEMTKWSAAREGKGGGPSDALTMIKTLGLRLEAE